MRIETFTGRHFSEAAALAQSVYEEERSRTAALPQMEPMPDFTAFSDNGLGVAAFEGNRMTGYLCCYPPFDSAFGTTEVKGVFSPMGANAAAAGQRAKIWAAMYQAAGEKWVKAGAVSHALCLYAHDEELQRQFYRLGFGLRCMDAIRPMEPVECAPCEGYHFSELPKEEDGSLYPLALALNLHFRESPCFMNRRADTPGEFAARRKEQSARYFAAESMGKTCAFLEITDTGETFASEGAAYRHISGAYCLPGHRGRQVFQNLLNYAINRLKEEGYTHLGVDFESINPAAYSFWTKYFSVYTHGVVRRIDERILACV